MRGALVASLAIALCGCTDQSMTKQPHYGPNGPAPVFANGSAAQTPPDGAVAQDAEASAQTSATPPPLDLALLRRDASASTSSARPAMDLRETETAPSSGEGFPVRHPITTQL